MARIHVIHPHSMDLPEARAVVDELARELKQRFAAKTQWDDNILHVSRSGAKGTVTVAPGAVEVEMKLSGPAAFAKPMVEKRMKEILAQRLR